MGKKRKSKAQHVDEVEEEVPVGRATRSMVGEVEGDKKKRQEVSSDKKLMKKERKRRLDKKQRDASHAQLEEEEEESTKKKRKGRLHKKQRAASHAQLEEEEEESTKKKHKRRLHKKQRAASHAQLEEEEEQEEEEEEEPEVEEKEDTMLPLKSSRKVIRKKGSASKLIAINQKLSDLQKERICEVGFGGLLKLKCPNVPELLSRWLVSIFDLESSQLIVPFKGKIVVDDEAVNRFFGFPIGKQPIVYKQRSSEETYNQFYDTVGKSKAPKFYEEERWFVGAGRDEASDIWLRRWLLFAVSSFLCPTTCEQLCVKVYHSIHDVGSIKNYNWCDLVVKQLTKGIKKLKDGKSKSASGCLMLLTLFYVDSLKTDLVIESGEQNGPRASLWTKALIDKAIEMDFDKETKRFGNLKTL